MIWGNRNIYKQNQEMAEALEADRARGVLEARVLQRFGYVRNIGSFSEADLRKRIDAGRAGE